MGETANLSSRLAVACERGGWGLSVAYLCGDAAYTHDDVHRGAARFATHLEERGLRERDRVLIALPDGIAFVWSFLGTIHLGAIAIPVAPALPAAERAAIAARLEVDAVLADPDEVEGAASTGPERAGAECDEDAPAYAQLTSGTTGPPKAALHRHGDPFVFHRAFGVPVLGLAPEETVLSVSKMFFAYGLGNSLFYPLLSGSSAVLVAGKPTPAGIAASVAERGVDVLFGVPTFFARLLAGGHGPELRGLRLAITAGEPLPIQVGLDFERGTGVPLLDGIGSTEVGQAFSSNRVGDSRPGTVGRPLPPYRVRVVDTSGGRHLATGQEGTIQVSGPTTLLEYLGGEDDDRYEGEWMRTDDLGFLDEEGFLHIRGRADDVEIVSGMKLHPQCLEQRLTAHPSVVEAAICAVPDSDGAARLTAFVVRRDGPSDASLAAELRERANEGQRPGHSVRSVVFVAALPRTATGKVMRFRLRQAGSVAASAV